MERGADSAPPLDQRDTTIEEVMFEQEARRARTVWGKPWVGCGHPSRRHSLHARPADHLLLAVLAGAGAGGAVAAARSVTVLLGVERETQISRLIVSRWRLPLTGCGQELWMRDDATVADFERDKSACLFDVSRSAEPIFASLFLNDRLKGRGYILVTK